MIEHLKTGRAAYFYKRKKALSDTAITGLFATLRQNSQKPSQNLFREVRVRSGLLGIPHYASHSNDNRLSWMRRLACGSESSDFC